MLLIVYIMIVMNLSLLYVYRLLVRRFLGLDRVESVEAEYVDGNRYRLVKMMQRHLLLLWCPIDHRILSKHVSP